MKHSCEGVCIIIGVDVALIVNMNTQATTSSLMWMCSSGHYCSLVVCRHSALTPPTSPMCNYYSVESVGVPTHSVLIGGVPGIVSL